MRVELKDSLRATENYFSAMTKKELDAFMDDFKDNEYLGYTIDEYIEILDSSMGAVSEYDENGEIK